MSIGDGNVVLIVEDNEKNLKLVRDVLQYHGFTTFEATNARDGIRAASELHPNVILMDIELPDMDGVTALSHIRADLNAASIPVIALTASAMPDDRQRFTDAGFDGYLVKPIDIRAFPDQVRSFCKG
jgi:two-component system cell cycle response regulator DivK